MIIQYKVDSVRRVLIPLQLYNELNLSSNQEMEITFEYGKICIKKFQPEDIYNRQFVGIVRKLDDFHRIVIPIEYLRILQIEPNAQIALEWEDEVIKIY